MTQRVLRLAAIGGDGIGPEVVAATLPVLAAAVEGGGGTLVVSDLDWGGERYLRTGEVAPADAPDIVRNFDAVLFGAVGRYDVPDDIPVWDLVIRLRQGLQLAVNVRPVHAFPGVPSHVRDVEGVDFVVVRENTEGEYAGIGGRAHGGTGAEIAVEVAVHSAAAIRRVAGYAFQEARRRSAPLVAVSKSNAMRHGYALWDQVVAEVAAGFPDVAWERVFVDAMAARMIERPRSLGVVLASNLFGDILSDLGAVLGGGLGMAPSANICADGSGVGLFEPVHGSAPDIAGSGAANPLGCVLSGAMLLDHTGFAAAAARVRDAVAVTVADLTARTPDIGGRATTAQVAARLLDAVTARRRPARSERDSVGRPGLTAREAGTRAGMTQTPDAEDQPDRATTVGETGGLPGRNAAPEASQLSEDEMADTVSGAGPAGGTAADEPESSTAGNG